MSFDVILYFFLSPVLSLSNSRNTNINTKEVKTIIKKTKYLNINIKKLNYIMIDIKQNLEI